MRNSRNNRFCWAGVFALAAALGSVAQAYVLRTDDSNVYHTKWVESPVEVQVKLSKTANLLDGTSYSGSVVAAMQAWNAQLGTVQFAWSELGAAPYKNGDQINEIVMDSKIDGDDFPEGTLAVTMSYYSGDIAFEADIVVNTAYTWNSYRGNLRSGTQDIRRVVMHELGHALGLDHPDEAGQTVSALMNSRVSNLEGLQADDIAGGQLLYGAPGFVPANNNFSSAATVFLSNGTAEVTGNNLAATKEAGEPSYDGSQAVHSVWWKWTAPAAGSVVLNTLGSDFDTVLGVATGQSVSTLVTIAANDDEDKLVGEDYPGRKRTSKVSFSAQAGTTYYFAVDGFGEDSFGLSGQIKLSVSFTPSGPITSRPTLTNISSRAYCGTGDNVTIGGFVIAGNAGKRVLIRAVGPTLTSFGIAEAEVLKDPVLQVFRGATVRAENDNWAQAANAAEITSESQRIGANKLAGTDTKSAAILITLEAGAYTCVVKGAGNTSGIVLLEVYDVDGSTDTRLINIASRAYATTGNGVTIGGFVISGTGAKHVLVRAVGPTLTRFGLAAGDVLANPAIELYRGANKMETNDDWSGSVNAATIKSTGARVGASVLDDTDTKSSALLTTLSAGAYTFIAKSSPEGSSGIVLVEVYDAD